jgi:hypothetical protein
VILREQRSSNGHVTRDLPTRRAREPSAVAGLGVYAGSTSSTSRTICSRNHKSATRSGAVNVRCLARGPLLAPSGGRSTFRFGSEAAASLSTRYASREGTERLISSTSNCRTKDIKFLTVRLQEITKKLFWQKNFSRRGGHSQTGGGFLRSGPPPSPRREPRSLRSPPEVALNVRHCTCAFPAISPPERPKELLRSSVPRPRSNDSHEARRVDRNGDVR